MTEQHKKKLEELLEHLKDKNTDGHLTEACGKLHAILQELDDDSNPQGPPPPPPGH